MKIKEIEKYWIESSDDTIDSANKLFKNKKYTHSMFFLHLSIEKILKALYVNQNKNEPPYSHNLQNIAVKIQNISLNKNQLKLLAKFTTFNISARYDDYKMNFHKICNKNFAEKNLKLGKELLKWLKSQLI